MLANRTFVMIEISVPGLSHKIANSSMGLDGTWNVASMIKVLKF
jgi:hypothetical protein